MQTKQQDIGYGSNLANRRRRMTEMRSKLSIEIQSFLDEDKRAIQESLKAAHKKMKFHSLQQVQSMWDLKKQNGFSHEYRLGRKLGEGCHSTVYQCFCLKDSRPYAVKILRGQDPELMDSFRESYRVLRRLEHENIVQARALFINQKSLTMHLVMDYFDWDDLSCFIQKGHVFSKRSIAEIIGELLRAVAYLHGAGVCHRDIKFDNVLYNPEKGKVRVIDFELARMKKYSNRKLEMLTKFGMPMFRAPEMFDSLYDEKVDIWSIGIIAYKLISGNMPFESDYEAELILKIQREEPSYEGMSVWEQDILKKLLCKDPKKRPSASQLLSSPFLFMNLKQVDVHNTRSCGLMKSPSLGAEDHEASFRVPRDIENKFYDDDVTSMFLGCHEADIGVIRVMKISITSYEDMDPLECRPRSP